MYILPYMQSSATTVAAIDNLQCFNARLRNPFHFPKIRAHHRPISRISIIKFFSLCFKAILNHKNDTHISLTVCLSIPVCGWVCMYVIWRLYARFVYHSNNDNYLIYLNLRYCAMHYKSDSIFIIYRYRCILFVWSYLCIL